MTPIRVAILDMYNNEPNQGMRCIKEIVDAFDLPFEWKVYNVRAENEVPDSSYDIYISSGGPGNPHEGNGVWDKNWFHLIENLWQHNQNTSDKKKYVFFICHSFQMACIHFKIGTVGLRRSTAFGVFPTHKTNVGMHDPLLRNMPEPYYVVDSRNWQVTQPDQKVLQQIGAEVLSLEKIRLHVDLERAVMAIRFSDEFFGTQYHPEADAQGMLQHFQVAEKKQYVINTFGEQKYQDMLNALRDPEKIMLTHQTILPGFLRHATTLLRQQCCQGQDRRVCQSS